MPMNVALVVLDTLRYDAFEEHFDGSIESVNICGIHDSIACSTL